MIISLSWWVLHLWWLSAGVGLVIVGWWVLFLVLMPAAWQNDQMASAGSASEASTGRWPET